jgi:hypothetical protein
MLQDNRWLTLQYPAAGDLGMWSRGDFGRPTAWTKLGTPAEWNDSRATTPFGSVRLAVHRA